MKSNPLKVSASDVGGMCDNADPTLIDRNRIASAIALISRFPNYPNLYVHYAQIIRYV